MCNYHARLQAPRGLLALCLVGFLSFVLALSGCSKTASGQAESADARKKIVVPVTVGTAEEKSVPVRLKAIGKVQAYSTVAIKAQVEGELMGVHFTEGQEVKRDAPLFTIDPRPFEAQVKQAEANLAKDKFQMENARRQSDRYGSVVEKGYVSKEVHDQVVTNAMALEAGVKADEAALDSARLNLKYCYISSPIDGVTGELKLHQGNLVKANDDTISMVIINQTSPIYVSFAVPEQNLSELKRRMASGKLTVRVTIPGDEGRPVRGELCFLDNSVDPTTGTIQLKACFPNKDKVLWPGQYVNVVLKLGTEAGVVVVPSQAVQVGQQGHYAFVVKPDGLTVEYRPVVVGRELDGELVIEKGITVGERVVTDGQMRLAEGTQVKASESSRKTSSEGNDQ